MPPPRINTFLSGNVVTPERNLLAECGGGTGRPVADAAQPWGELSPRHSSHDSRRLLLPRWRRIWRARRTWRTQGRQDPPAGEGGGGGHHPRRPRLPLIRVNDAVLVAAQSEPEPEDPVLQNTALNARNKTHIIRKYDPTLTNVEEQCQLVVAAREYDPNAWMEDILSTEEEEEEDANDHDDD